MDCEGKTEHQEDTHKGTEPVNSAQKSHSWPASLNPIPSCYVATLLITAPLCHPKDVQYEIMPFQVKIKLTFQNIKQGLGQKPAEIQAILNIHNFAMCKCDVKDLLL